MTDETDAVEAGDEGLSIEEAASTFAKTMTEEPEGQPEEMDEEEVQAEDDLPDKSEPDDEEDDGEPDPDGDAEGEDEDEPETEHGRFVAKNGRVKLDDGSVVTVSDLINGSMKEKDYRQKTMGLADERRQYEEQSKALQASAKEVAEQRDYMVNLFQSIMPQMPDPAMTDPNSERFDIVGYQHQKARYEAFAQHLQYLQQQSETARQQTDTETRTQREQQAAKEWDALQERLPELKDRAKGVAFANDIKSAATDYGFSPQEIAEKVPYDHRMALVLRDAGKWRKLQASKPKAQEKVQGRPPVQRGGKRLNRNAQQAKKATDAMNRLKQSGSIDDAVAAFLASNKG